MSQISKETKRMVRSYVIGFGLSLGLTIVAFTAAIMQSTTDGAAYPNFWLVLGLVTLAIVQLVVQLLFFFHLGRETKPRLNTVSFLFMLMVVGIIGFGSIWIMYNLNYNMMTPHETENYIKTDENIKLTPSSHSHH